MDLKEESERATQLLKGKVVEKVVRHRVNEVMIEFTGGARLFIDQHPDDVELSITGTGEDEIE